MQTKKCKVELTEDLEKRKMALNLFLAIDLSLQLIIPLAKMHKKHILHSSIKLFNLKLLYRYSLVLDNFENCSYSENGKFYKYYAFSNNPYNGCNAI